MLGVADLVEDIVTEFNTLKSTINEAIMIANQIEGLKRQLQSLVYEAQNLQKNPLQLAAQISQLWGQYNGLLQETTGLTYRVTQSATKFAQAYGALTGIALSGTVADMQQASKAFLDQLRFASRTAVQTQSIYEQLCDLQRQNDLALTSAQQAVGALQVQQALAQQQALSNQQLSTLAEIEAANGRMQAAWLMKQVGEEDAAKASNDRWIATYGVQGFHGVKAGQGVDLP